MKITILAQTRQRHATNFTKDFIVFSAEEYTKKVEVIVEDEHGQRTFGIYLNGERMTATTNYPKAIGQAILTLNQN
jgi:hypothetical protein